MTLGLVFETHFQVIISLPSVWTNLFPHFLNRISHYTFLASQTYSLHNKGVTGLYTDGTILLSLNFEDHGFHFGKKAIFSVYIKLKCAFLWTGSKDKSLMSNNYSRKDVKMNSLE